jgi:LysM repeat protein
VEGLDGETDPIVVATGPSGRTAIVQASGGGAPVATRYTVRRGDTLWRIAQNHGVSVSRLKAVNAIRSSRIKPGQVLSIPAR